jgi:hypothetical protein
MSEATSGINPARRNDIAHGTTWMTDAGTFLVPAYYNIRKYTGDCNPAYR